MSDGAHVDPGSMTGLQVLQAMLDGRMPPPSMALTIPTRGISAEHGRVVFAARADERHLNPLGLVHGGFAATVLDTVAACAALSAMDAGETALGTVDLNVKMLRPVPRDTDLLAEGRVIHIGRTLAMAEATLEDDEGRLLAHATATCMRLPKA